MNDPISNGNILIDDDRTGITIPVLKRAILENLFYVVGKWPEAATDKDYLWHSHRVRPHPHSLAHNQ